MQFSTAPNVETGKRSSKWNRRKNADKYALIAAACFGCYILIDLILSIKNKKAVSGLWFIPGLIIMSVEMSSWFFGNNLYLFTVLPPAGAVLAVAGTIIEAAGLLFVGLWLWKSLPVREAAAMPYAPPPVYAPPAPGPQRPVQSEKNYPQNIEQPAAPRFCGKCGAKNTAGNAFCQSCGAPLTPRS